MGMEDTVIKVCLKVSIKYLLLYYISLFYIKNYYKTTNVKGFWGVGVLGFWG